VSARHLFEREAGFLVAEFDFNKVGGIARAVGQHEVNLFAGSCAQVIELTGESRVVLQKTDTLQHMSALFCGIIKIIHWAC
jgi:hypothetical protein